MLLDNAPSRADFVLVKLDGTQINLNDPNGWRLQGDKTIELSIEWANGLRAKLQGRAED